VISRWQALEMLAAGVLIAGVIAVAFARGTHEGRLAAARTMALCMLAYAQPYFVFSCRSRTKLSPELGYSVIRRCLFRLRSPGPSKRSPLTSG
jgi:hypothetical protein